MKNAARRIFDEIIRSRPQKKKLSSQQMATEGARFSTQFIYLGQIILQTRNISSIEKFEFSQEVVLGDAVRSRQSEFLNQGLMHTAASLVLMFSGYAISQQWFELPNGSGPVLSFLTVFLTIGFLYSAIRNFLIARYLGRFEREEQLKRSDYFVDVVMNSGRLHRILTKSNDMADTLVNLFVRLISSDDDKGTVFKIDQSTNNLVVDNSDRSISNMQIGDDLEFSVEIEDDEKNDQK